MGGVVGAVECVVAQPGEVRLDPVEVASVGGVTVSGISG